MRRTAKKEWEWERERMKRGKGMGMGKERGRRDSGETGPADSECFQLKAQQIHYIVQ